jgi:hemoglobin/transferrin/lactoferrin receptor protein
MELAWNANGALRADEMPPTEMSKPEIYALDAAGRPFAPGWQTLAIRSAYTFERGLTLTAGLDNVTDQRYRSYSSGVVAPGRNLIVSLRYAF